MIGLGTLAKIAKDGADPETLKALLGAMGIELDMQPIPIDRTAFGKLAESASQPGAKMIELNGRIKDGDSVHALLVFASAGCG